jgi:hypothetical protein
MGVFEWLEQSPLADWVRSSFVGWPLMLTLHSLGMGICVGLWVVLSLRLLGLFRGLPLAALYGVLPIAWAGLAINVLGGTAIFASQAVHYVHNVPFLLKMAGVVGGALLAAYLQRLLAPLVAATTAGRAAEDASAITPSARWTALVALLVWAFALVTGRLTAYL